MDWQKFSSTAALAWISAQLFSFCEERLFCEERHHISPTDLGLSLQQRARVVCEKRQQWASTRRIDSEEDRRSV
jgi:hypothetical protein